MVLLWQRGGVNESPWANGAGGFCLLANLVTRRYFHLTDRRDTAITDN